MSHNDEQNIALMCAWFEILYDSMTYPEPLELPGINPQRMGFHENVLRIISSWNRNEKKLWQATWNTPLGGPWNQLLSPETGNFIIPTDALHDFFSGWRGEKPPSRGIVKWIEMGVSYNRGTPNHPFIDICLKNPTIWTLPIISWGFLTFGR